MSIKLLNDDVALKFITTQKAKGSAIFVEENDDDVVKFFEVVAVSEKVTDIVVGDIVIAPWTKVTNKFKAPINGVETDICVTSIKEVLGVVDTTDKEA